MARGAGCKDWKGEQAEPRFGTPRVGDTVESGPFAGFEIISVYSREQALADGVLADVSTMATEAGYTVPVALTAAVNARVEPSKAERAYGQDREGRLWDVLWMARVSGAAQKAAREGEAVFELYFQTRGRKGERAGLHKHLLRVTLDQTGAGDTALTVSEIDED